MHHELVYKNFLAEGSYGIRYYKNFAFFSSSFVHMIIITLTSIFEMWNNMCNLFLFIFFASLITFA